MINFVNVKIESNQKFNSIDDAYLFIINLLYDQYYYDSDNNIWFKNVFCLDQTIYSCYELAKELYNN